MLDAFHVIEVLQQVDRIRSTTKPRTTDKRDRYPVPRVASEA
jgi:hypothetical protein